MTFNWSTLLTLGIITATIHWIVARSKIMKWFWNAIWLPKRVNQLLECPACSGFWLGIAVGMLGVTPLTAGSWWFELPAAGIAGTFATPVLQAVLLWGLKQSEIH